MSRETTPRVLKGFRDMLPEQELVREELLTQIRNQFRRRGFVPIDTPILEYSEALVGNGGEESDKQLYRFTDQGGRDVAMRYDLTVPLARFVAQHFHLLHMPLRRYQIGKVFRGENPQRGRFREFIQCDFDIVGSRDVLSDYDTLELSLAVLSTIIPASKLQLRISHRDLLPLFIGSALSAGGALSAGSAMPDESGTEMARALPRMRVIIDKIHKIGAEAVRAELASLLTDSSHIDALMEFIQRETRATDELTPERMMGIATADTKIRTPLERLQTLLSLLHKYHQEVDVVIDPSIMRGLTYYTGVIFEVYHRDMMGLGALSSGGRYDTLTARYRRDEVPAIGGSIGIDRILSIPTIADTVRAGGAVEALVCHERGAKVEQLLEVAHYLRQRGKYAEIYPHPAKLHRQFIYAEEKNIKYGIITTQNKNNVLQYEAKHLSTKDRYACSTLDALFESLT